MFLVRDHFSCKSRTPPVHVHVRVAIAKFKFLASWAWPDRPLEREFGLQAYLAFVLLHNLRLIGKPGLSI